MLYGYVIMLIYCLNLAATTTPHHSYKHACNQHGFLLLGYEGKVELMLI